MAPKKKATITLPPYVRCVRSRGREYFYLHVGRGSRDQQHPLRLPDDPRQPEFWEAYRRATKQPPPRLNPKSFEHAIEAYRMSPEFTDLAASTRRDYERYLDKILSAWGHLEVCGLLPAHVLKLRDKHRKTPAAANALIRTLSALISWSVPRGYRIDNPCEHVRKLTIGDGWAAWPWEMIELLEKCAPTWMWEAAALALYTGQRQGDVLAMSWTKIKNGLIEVKQEKTGRELVIPAHQRLLAILAQIEARRRAPQKLSSEKQPRPLAVQILVNSRGLPWTSDGFRASWQTALSEPVEEDGKACGPWTLGPIKEAGLVFHGLRKSAVVMLLEAGCTTAEVQAITGQSMQMVDHYSKQVNQRKLAASAILKLERAGERPPRAE